MQQMSPQSQMKHSKEVADPPSAPIQLCCQSRGGSRALEDVIQTASGTVLCDDTGRLQAHSQVHDHIGVPH